MREYLCGRDPGDKDSRMVSETEDCAVYHMKNDIGELTVREYRVFPGIWLMYKDAHTEKYEYPAAYPKDFLEITHCREGRFEYDAGGQFFYLAQGDMSINRSIGQGAAVYCPLRHYHGISIAIDPGTAPSCLSCVLDDVNVQPAALLEKFCGEGETFIMRSTPKLEHIFSELYSVPEEIRKGFFKVKILELLLFLSNLNPALSQTKAHSCRKEQVELARRVCQYVSGHMDLRPTTKQLAAMFYVSPASIKKCFYDVYGESVYAYIRAYKMQSAAWYLESTDQAVSEIAGKFGYDNSSKFSKAFRDVMGMTPKEYRLNVRELETEQFGAEEEPFGVEIPTLSD